MSRAAEREKQAMCIENRGVGIFSPVSPQGYVCNIGLTYVSVHDQLGGSSSKGRALPSIVISGIILENGEYELQSKHRHILGTAKSGSRLRSRLRTGTRSLLCRI